MGPSPSVTRVLAAREGLGKNSGEPGTMRRGATVTQTVAPSPDCVHTALEGLCF